MFEILKIFILLQIFKNAYTNTDDDIWCRSEKFICSDDQISCDVGYIDIDKEGEIQTFFNLSRYEKLKKIENINIKNENVIYINGAFDDNEKSFKLYGTEKFKEFSRHENVKDFDLVARFSCTDELGFHFENQKCNIKLRLNEENLYEPVFSKDVYETKISLPFIQGYECLLEKSIYAIDWDIEYNKIHFSTNNEYFDLISIKDQENPKKYYVSFKLKKSITAIEDKLEIDIKAEDNGNPKKSSMSKLILTVDKQKSLIEPRFVSPSYKGYLSDTKILHIEKVILNQSTYDQVIQFQKLGKDSDFFTILPKTNEIEIQLKDGNIDDESIKNKTFLTFTIEAKHPQIQNPGQTVIFIDLPRKTGIPGGIRFEKNVYRGEIKDNVLQIENFKLLDDIDKNVYQFEIRGQDQKLFDLDEINKNELKLRLLDDANWEDQPYLFISIVAKLKGFQESSTTVIIDVPASKDDFRFEKPLFMGKINQQNELENLEIKFYKDEILDDIVLNLSGEDSDEFEISKTDIIQIKLKELNELPTAWSKKKFLSFNIQARKHNQDEIFSAILINLPTKLQVPQFDEILYEGKIISKDEIKIQDIPVEKLGYTMFRLSGHNSFSFDQNDGKIKILSKGLTDEDLQLDFIALTLKATFNDNDGQKSESSTSIVFATPRSITPPGPTTPLPPSEEPPVFEKNLYRFSLKSDSIGIFGAVKALLNGKPSNDIKYSLGQIDDELNSRLTMNIKDGSLELTATITPKIYTFEVLTTRLGINYNNAFVILEVSPIKYCGDKDSKVENSLLVRTLKEEEPHYGILNTVEGNCHFQISKISENDKDYFNLNSTTNQLDLLPVDREDLKFSGMLVVQLQLTLTLHDDPNKITEDVVIVDNQPEIETNTNDHIDLEDTTKTYDNSTLSPRTFAFSPQSKSVILDERSYVLTDSIKSTTFETVLTIIVEDINDNSPIFKKPTSAAEYVIGYPDIEISHNILPEYLLQVYATDLDIGLNAEIRYKLNNTDFGINEKTGIIYPFSNAMQNSDEITFIVYAFDCDGKISDIKNSDEIMRNSTMKITVKKIFSNQAVLLEFQDTQMENVDELLRKLSENKKFNLKSLKWATIPNKNNNDNGKRSLISKMANNLYNSLRVQNQSNQKTTLKVWAYAFNKNNGIIETSDKIKEELSENSDIDVKSYQDQQSLILEEQNIIGFIVGIVILSIISIGSIGFILWVFCFRQMLYEKMSTPQRSDISSFDPSLENGNGTEPEIETYLKRKTIKILLGTTTQETSDYQTRMLEHLNDRNSTNSKNGVSNSIVNGSINNYDDNMSGDDNNSYQYRNSNDENLSNGDIGERRKSVVKFNELVERIEINERRDSEISGVSSERL